MELVEEVDASAGNLLEKIKPNEQNGENENHEYELWMQGKRPTAYFSYQVNVML